MQVTQVRSLGSEGPLEEGTATHSSILAWRIPMDRGIWKATVHGVAKTQTWLKQLSMHAYIAVLSEPKNVGLSWLISWRILATLASKQTDKLACVKKNGNWEGRWRLKMDTHSKVPFEFFKLYDCLHSNDKLEGWCKKMIFKLQEELRIFFWKSC